MDILIATYGGPDDMPSTYVTYDMPAPLCVRILGGEPMIVGWASDPREWRPPESSTRVLCAATRDSIGLERDTGIGSKYDPF